jgi:succinate-semialdehyde dehydrogenase / glutarate-semialdehyde dehydrogenase
MYISINPTTEETIEQHPSLDETGLEKILARAAEVQKSWKNISIGEKLSLVAELKKVTERRSDEIIQIIVSEMGKTKAQAGAEVGRLQGICDHALERLERIMEPEVISYPGASVPAKVSLEPLGVVFAITPWNVPVGTLLRSALPALLMGNTVLVKPAPNVAGCARLFEEMLHEAGFPEGVCRVVLLENELAEKLIADFRIRKVSFVGSTNVGAHLAAISGKHIKPILLELGGSDPFIVLKDADVPQAAIDAAGARCNNAGQVCCSSKRIIVEEGVYETFKELFVEQMAAKQCGNPFDEGVDIGPLARKDIYMNLVSQVEQAKREGLRVLLDGGSLEGKGYFFTPMVLEEKGERGMSTDEEFFGPVACLFKAKDPDHAVRIANYSRYGLGAAVYTSDSEKAETLAKGLENGFVYINRPPGLHPFLPFGGVKDSGFGKDCGDEGYLEYANKKIIIS